VFQTRLGRMLCGSSEDVLGNSSLRRLVNGVQLIFTSPPFPLLRKKKYGNEIGRQYVEWLAAFAEPFRKMLKPDGSLVVEIGNAWEPGTPAMSTIPIQALLALKEAGGFTLCQEFIWHNPARLPSPAQWVTIERIRVKDSFTRIWWLSPTSRPKASNRKVLQPYSRSMKRLLTNGDYNSGGRPSEHIIGTESFLVNHGGSIPPNVLSVSNTRSTDKYQEYCRAYGFGVHPARMPASIPEFFIRMLTDERDIVLDPFAGSNTTGAAAERLNRQWLSIEQDRDYAMGAAGRFSKDAYYPKTHD
jgi:DNA modification methylase